MKNLDISVKEITAQVKSDSFNMAVLSSEVRNNALNCIISSLLLRKEEIFSANAEDLKSAIASGEPAPIIARLKFDEKKLTGIIQGIHDLIGLSDPLFKKLLERDLDADLTLFQVTCPIGVIGVIFESRPDALIQISTLCIKSGNCSILKGGKEAARTNSILFEIIHTSGVSSGLPYGFITLIESRSGIDALLKCHESVDLLIPRGSNEFVQYIMSNSKIPVMGHADGVCHIYIHEDADFSKAVPIILDSKTQYVAACNTVETLLVHQAVAPTFLPMLKSCCENNAIKITLKGCNQAVDLISCQPATEADFHTEYLDYILSIKVVSDINEAISHINKYGSHHTDCIITETDANAEMFMANVDSAGVYQNCSTRFADGFRYGFGAEVGISTGKLHARGPVGLEGLVTYKYKLLGNGHIVSDYADGRKSFNFKTK